MISATSTSAGCSMAYATARAIAPARRLLTVEGDTPRLPRRASKLNSDTHGQIRRRAAFRCHSISIRPAVPGGRCYREYGFAGAAHSIYEHARHAYPRRGDRRKEPVSLGSEWRRQIHILGST